MRLVNNMSDIRSMRKIAIFGNAGGGKSTLAKQIAGTTQLPLYSLDQIKYRPGGDTIPHEEYLTIHSKLVNQDAWIIDGFGCRPSAWERFAAADTLIYIDLPLWNHAAWITKRLMQGIWSTPEGWPENSPILKGSFNSYKVLWLCHRHLTPAYRKLIGDSKNDKQVFHLRTAKDIKNFCVELIK